MVNVCDYTYSLKTNVPVCLSLGKWLCPCLPWAAPSVLGEEKGRLAVAMGGCVEGWL